MNKNAIKNYAVWARTELMKQVAQKAYEYGVTESSLPNYNTDNVNGRLLSSIEKKQLNELIREVKKNGYDHVIEEVAYTWFNRFIALRYMEVNNYLPQRIRVFTNDSNEFKPDLLTDAIHVELDGLDKQKVFDYIEENKQEELYKYLLLTLCNDMNQYLPDMFTSIKKQDYKILLLPDNLLKEDGVLARLIKDIPEEDWNDKNVNSDEPTNAITIIGWMYQYYISKRHDEVINILKGTVKKEDIPAATELFTTDWVVRYMVDNSLGRYWIERNPDSGLKGKLKFLATNKDGTLPIVENDPVKPEELTFFDPCMGSGHILAYAFDVLMEIYRESGYTDRDAALSIVENNLYGLDIDERAYQLSYFSIMMKGCLYDRRFLKRNVSTHLSYFVETNNIGSLSYEGMQETEESKVISNYLLQTFKDALELGSLIQVQPKDYVAYKQYIDDIHDSADYSLDSLEWMDSTYYTIIKLIKQADILSRKYCITTTNPPYMSKMDGQLKKFVVKNYKDYSSDLFAVFVKRNFDFTKENGYLGFMTPFVWMFIKSYEKLREYIINNKSIATLVQMEYSAYEEATVPICSFVLSNNKINNIGYYFRLSDFKGGMEVQKQKVLEAIKNKDCGYFYETDSNNFSKIPGKPLAYWVSKKMTDWFDEYNLSIDVIGSVGIQTGDNEKFIRLWHEVNSNFIKYNATKVEESYCNQKWFPYNKGGDYRKWCGNDYYVVLWQNDGAYLKKDNKITGHHYQEYKDNLKFAPLVTWSRISSGKPSFRIKKYGFLSDMAGFSIFSKVCNLRKVIAFCNSKVAEQYLKFMAPTLNIMIGNVLALPFDSKIVFDSDAEKVVDNCIEISKNDWDSFETSWDFKIHPLVKNHVSTINEAYNLWNSECESRFNTLKSNEEELNRIFIDIYGLQDELDPYVEDKDVTVRKADLVRDIKSFISYAVGCMFGRYSLDVEGLAYAGGDWDSSKYSTFIPDADDIIPICDEEYFEDDIVTRFVEFVRVVYGTDTLEDNLSFIANALGGKGAPRDVLRNYFLNDFFKDHCNTYQVTGSGKRPIYWLFDSGKKNGFKALVYIHRYTPDLIARMRTGYVHPQQARYRTQVELLQNQIDDASSTSEKVKLTKQLKKINEQLLELNKYEEIVHHWADKMEPMDLDDGVKANYAKFQELLAKIK